jgi:hypothetical protein
MDARRPDLLQGTAEQWKEGKHVLERTRLSCHWFLANPVRLQLFVLAYNLGNFPRRLALPEAVKDRSLRSVQVKLVTKGGRLGAMPGVSSSSSQRWQCLLFQGGLNASGDYARYWASSCPSGWRGTVGLGEGLTVMSMG